MSCRERLDRKLNYFESRSDIASIRDWIARGQADHRRFLKEKYPFIEQPGRIDELTPDDIWNPASPCDSFLGWLMCQLRPLGGLNERLSEQFSNASRNASRFKELLRMSLGDAPIDSKVEAWQGLRGFGGGKHVAKKIIASYFDRDCLPMFNTEHMAFFARHLGLDVQEQPTEGKKWVHLTATLLTAKQHHERLAPLDNVYFMYVLYFSRPAPLPGNLREPFRPIQPVWCVGDPGPPPGDTIKQPESQTVELKPALAEIIRQGEGQSVEFKPCMLQDVSGKKGAREIRHEIAKTVAGFLNTAGGTLLIGVRDDGTPDGIGADLKTLGPRGNRDQFQQEFWKIMKMYLGDDLDPQLVKLDFDESMGPMVCVVEVGESGQDRWVLHFDRDRRNREEFWVRRGTSTEELKGQAASTYIRNHFPREPRYLW